MKRRVFSVLLALCITLTLVPAAKLAGRDEALEALGFEAFAADKNIWYVTQNGAGNKDGFSWANAASDLAYIMRTRATAGDEIWVAAGTYSPGANATDTFFLKKGVKVYGGFAGSETDLSNRVLSESTKSVLDGKIDENSNVYRVVTGESGATPEDTRLDGFTVTGGNAAGSHSDGGGMFNNSSSPTVANCIFFANAANYGGGGIYNYESSPTIVNCTFSDNTANDGGGVYNNKSNPTVKNCTFSGNTATAIATEGGLGGGMFNHNSGPILINCTLSDNTATNDGGGICSFSGSAPTVVNTILWNNTASYGRISDIFQYKPGSLTLDHCVVGDYNTINTTVSALNLIQSDPLLIALDRAGNPAADSGEIYIYGLQSGSSAIDAGLSVGNRDINGVTVTVPGTDQRGMPRTTASVDIGAFEWGDMSPEPVTKYQVTVNNGTGSGLYATGEIVTITANNPSERQRFKEWTGEDDLVFVEGGKTSSTAKLLMPDRQLNITATYEDIISSVSVAPDTARVQKGTTQSFFVTVTGTGDYDNTVTWTVEGGISGTAISDSGVLTVAADESATTLTVKATANGDANKFAMATVTVSDTPITKYLLTVIGGTGGAEYEANDTVTITANQALEGQQFTEWTGVDNLVFVDGTSKTSRTAKFTMPSAAVTVTAIYNTALTGTLTLDLDSNTGEVTASVSGGNTASAGALYYSWTNATPATGAAVMPIFGEETVCTVTSENYAGSISEKIFVYKVAIGTVTGNKGNDAVSITDQYGTIVGGPITIDYTIDETQGSGENKVEFAVENSYEFGAGVYAGNTPNTMLYSIHPLEADGQGNITINVTFTHTNRYNLTFSGTGTASFGDGSYLEGERREIFAGNLENKIFSHWTSSVENLVFEGGASAKQTHITMPAINLTLTAHWVDSNHTVSFNYNGKGEPIPNNPRTIPHNTTVQQPDNPTESGWTFIGWYKESDCVNPFDFGTPITADTIIYAKWIDAGTPTYSVTVNNGTANPGTAAQGMTVTIKANEPQSGQRFKNWTVSGGAVNLSDINASTASFTMPANAVEVTANYEDIPQTGNYHTGDIAIINAVINAHPELGLEKAEPADGSYAPSGWTGKIGWSTDAPRRVEYLRFENLGLIGHLDLKGLTGLQAVYCQGNQLTSLDVGNLTNLMLLECQNNQLTALNVGSLTALNYFDCSHNRLGGLNVGNLTNLQFLDCAYNQLTELNVSSCGALQDLNCSDNELDTLDISSCTALKKLNSSINRLSALSTENLGNLTQLYCSYNQLSTLNVSGCTALQQLDCSDNQLSGTLNVEALTNLTNLKCINNKLSTLTLGSLPSLSWLECYNNELTELDVSGLTSLSYLDCAENYLDSLNVKNLATLNTIYCRSNNLTGLDVSGTNSLSELNVSYNLMTGTDKVTGKAITWEGDFIFNPQYTQYQNVTFSAVQTGGSIGTASSTGIVLTFNQSVENLAKDKIFVIGITGAVKTGELSGAGITWTLELTEVIKPGDVSVWVESFQDFRVTNSPKRVAVYKEGPGGGMPPDPGTPPGPGPGTPPTVPTISVGDMDITMDYNINEEDFLLSLIMPEEKINEILAKGVEDGRVGIDVSGMENIRSAEMPKAAFDAFVQQDLAFKLKLPTGSMTLNKAAASSIRGQLEQLAGLNLNMELLPIEPEELTTTQQAFVKTGDVIVDINIGTGEQKFSSFGDGQLEVQISYTGDLPVAVWYLSDEGELQKIQNATYSEETGLVTFHLDHLSLYVLGKDTEAGGGSGVTLTGKIKSYNPGASLTVKLMQDDVEKYIKTLDAGSGSGQIEQDFSIGGVAAGTYKLVVEKACHLKYTISGVEVGTSDLNLTAAAEDKPYKTITLLCGDLNGDGRINDDDLNTVWKPTNYLKTPGADGVDNSTDLNGDGKINDEDLNIVWNPSAYLKGISNCTFNY